MPSPDAYRLQRLELGAISPVEMAGALAHLPGLVFFDSALESPAGHSVSIIAAAPLEMVRGHIERDWTRLRAALCSRKNRDTADAPFPLGFAAGAVDYEGAFEFGVYENALFFDHQAGQWYERGELSKSVCLGDSEAAGKIGHRHGESDFSDLSFVPEMDEATFLSMVRRAQEYIAAGDIYQVNLAQRFTAAFDFPAGHAFSFYNSLRHYSPAPFGAYLDLGERQILSTSPESFLRLSGRRARTRPIKGTRPRRADPQADEKSLYDLLTSSKEIAELIMITDLERSDLGQVSEWGSVTVRELLALERFEQVFHLVSTVESNLRREVDHLEAFRACFPGGSITGAPKRRAREIIAELEPIPRGLYTGAVGWFGFNDDSHFNIAIRTVVIENHRAHFHVGAGIVADSVPEREYQETLDKAAGILLAAERWKRVAAPHSATIFP